MEYWIEQLATDGHWHIVGVNPSSVSAQIALRGFRRKAPSDAFRIVEQPSGRLIVCEGGEAL